MQGRQGRGQLPGAGHDDGRGAVVDSHPRVHDHRRTANHLAFLPYPAVQHPALLSPQPAVAVVDIAGNVVTGDSRTITLSINQNAGTFACSGGPQRWRPTPASPSSAGCTQSIVANGYTISAAAPSLSKITGAVFNVTSGLASRLTLCWGPAVPCSTTPPAPVTGATAFQIQPTVLIQDINGNTVPNDNTTTVTLSILGGTPVRPAGPEP